jgi:probable HAF family extracellular repeat protein
MIRLPGGDSSQALDLNTAGQIVGWAGTGLGAVLWENGRAIELPCLPFCNRSAAEAINENGQIVGTCTETDGNQRAVLWEKGEVFDLGSLPGHDWSRALGINNNGQIVGSSGHRYPSPFPIRATLWDHGKISSIANSTDIAANWAVDINDAGQIVGNAHVKHPVHDESAQRAVLWEKGELLVLPTLADRQESKAQAINNRGQIVGHCSPWDVPGDDDDAWFAQFQPVLWEKGEIVALSTLQPDGLDGAATAINDHGQIVGYCGTPDGNGHAVLWQDGIVVTLHNVPDGHGGIRNVPAVEP